MIVPVPDTVHAEVDVELHRLAQRVVDHHAAREIGGVLGIGDCPARVAGRGVRVFCRCGCGIQIAAYCDVVGGFGRRGGVANLQITQEPGRHVAGRVSLHALHAQALGVDQVPILVNRELAVAGVEGATGSAVVTLDHEHAVAFDGHVGGLIGGGKGALGHQLLYGECAHA